MHSKKRRAADASLSLLLDLPDEMLLRIVTLLPPRTVNLCCHRLRALSNNTVSELFVSNRSHLLSLDAICEKLVACAYTIRRLVMYGVYFTTENAFARFYAALNKCPNLCTLVLSPGTASSFALYDFMQAEVVRAVYALPITTGLSTCIRKDDEFRTTLRGDFELYVYPREKKKPRVKFSSLDSAISARPLIDNEGFYCATYDAWATQHRNLFLPGALHRTAIANNHELLFGSLWFDNYVIESFERLALVDTYDNASVRTAVLLHPGSQQANCARAQVCALRNICNVVCSFRMGTEELRAIKPAALHTVTLWVRPADLSYTRRWIHQNVRVIPAPIFWCS